MILNLKGKTQKGKNRVREWGTVWKVNNLKDTVRFSNNFGPWAFITPMFSISGNRKPLEMGNRWVNLKFDVDFIIEEK